MARARVLVVDDEAGMLEVCADTLSALSDVEIRTEQDSTRAAQRLSEESFDLLIVDLRMPEIGGMELLRIAREADPDVAALILTAYPSVDTAVESMKLGAADYIVKPFIPEDLQATVMRLLTERQLRAENRLLSRHVGRAYRFDEIIGQGPAMERVFDTIKRVAETDADVLILGETGTGKELVAQAIHRRSPRAGGRFVPVDCGAIPEHLLESELFGHERGAFTGAHQRSLGLMEVADKGTFFLDEIGELPAHLAAKLLRALQERRIRRVGGRHEIDADVRVIAATSRDLDEDVRAGRFRGDLYYRINVARIELPPLRKRPEDIGLLCRHFVQRFAQELGREDPRIDEEVIEVFSGYQWPGNVRELQNVIKRALVMSSSNTLSISDLPDELVMRAGDGSRSKGRGFFDRRHRQLATFEKQYLTDLLAACEGDVSRAAREAQVPRGTLYRLLNKHNLGPDQFRHPD